MEYTFVSAVHETFSEFDHISYQISLNQRVQIIIFILSDYNGTKTRKANNRNTGIVENNMPKYTMID